MNRDGARATARLALRGVAFATLATWALAAAADEPSILLIGGSQGSAVSSYTYLGAIKPMVGASVGRGGFYKTVASWLTYRYDTEIGGANVDVQASAPGIETGVGYAWDSVSFKSDVSLVAGVRNTRLRPDVDTDGPSGARLTLTPQLSSRVLLTRSLEADVIASYSFGTRGQFARVRVGAEPAAGWRAGLEAMLAAGPDYRNLQRGGFVGTSVAPGWFVELNAGRAEPHSGSSSSYIGISFSNVR